MRVNIETNEKTTGIFRKKTIYQVVCHVDWSEEEKQIIKKHHLEEAIVEEHEGFIEVNGRKLPIPPTRLKAFMDRKPFTVEVATPGLAKARVEKLEQQLRDAKAFIAENAELGQTRRTLEL